MIRFALRVSMCSLCPCPAVVAQAPTFTDATAAAGIDLKHVDGRSGRLYFLEELGSGAAFIDYDNDADLDIYLVNGADLPGFQSTIPPTNVLYANDGHGAFAHATPSAGVGDTGYGVGCCGGDIDNDGYLDLYVTNWGKNILYRNNANGTFRDVTDQANVGDERWGASRAFADYDRDGDPDLYATNCVQFQTDKNKTCRIRGVLTYCKPQDFIANGHVEYNVESFHPGTTYEQTNHLFRNLRDGTFEELSARLGAAFSQKASSRAAVFGDYDDDGDVDMLVTNSNEKPQLLRNDGGNRNNWLRVRVRGTVHELEAVPVNQLIYIDEPEGD